MVSIRNYLAKCQLGLTLIELVIVIAVVGVLAAISIPTYQNYIIKTQISEALGLAYDLKSNVVVNLQYGKCFANMEKTASTTSGLDSITGKFGKAIITSKADGLPPCGIKYEFISSGLPNEISGKTIVMNINDNHVLTNTAATNINSKYLPQAIK